MFSVGFDSQPLMMAHVGAVRTADRRPANEERPQPEELSLEGLVAEANKALAAFTTMDFMMDDELEETVVRVVDTKTQELIRQIPNEEMLTLSKRMRSLQGLLLDATA